MKARGYPVPGVDLNQVATLIHADLARAGYDVRIVPTAPPAYGMPPGVVVEIRRQQGLLQRSTGHGAVLKAWLTSSPVGFHVQVGTDRIGDAAAGAVEWLLATPALMTEGYAAFHQAQLDERIFRIVDHFVTNVARVPIQRAPATVPDVGPCPLCRTPMPYGARFCPRCAHDSQSTTPLAGCPGCKGPVALDAVFCPHCGRSVAAKPAANACVKCAASLDEGAVFCSSCGARQDGAKG